MTAAKRAPGPWRWVDEGGWWTLRSPDGTIVCDDGSAGCEYCQAIDPCGPDARLIASAPDLLAACELLVDWYRTHQDGEGPARMDAVFVAARAAIAKATGATS